jgi:hypothetical protein
MTAFMTITCNYRVATKANSRGAKAYLVGGWSDGPGSASASSAARGVGAGSRRGSTTAASPTSA